MNSAADAPRSLEVLLMIIGAVDGMPVLDSAIAEAYKLGAISPAEGRTLQRYARLSPRGRKMAALEAPEVIDAKNEALRAKLREARPALDALIAQRKARDL
jgi:hypothetical protein